MTTLERMDNKLEIMTRPAVGKEGRSIKLISNHFHVRLTGADVIFYQYTVILKYDNDNLVENKRISRKVIDKMCELYSSDLAGRHCIYDGDKTLFTVGPLPQSFLEFTVCLEETSARAVESHSGGDMKRVKRVHKSSLFKVALTYASKFPLNSVAVEVKGGESPHAQSALMVLNVILRQQQARLGCLVVRQSFFNGDPTHLTKLDGGVTACRGFHSSFNTTMGGLSLNMDVATTMVYTTGPVISFVIDNQNVEGPRQIDWAKAKRMLKNLRIKMKHNNMERKILGLSEFPCNQQRCLMYQLIEGYLIPHYRAKFALKVSDDDGDYHTEELTVSDYYRKCHLLDLSWSSYYPCIDIGKPRNPVYIPLELCDLVPLQRYKNALSSKQRASLLEKSRQRPHEKSRIIAEAAQSNGYSRDPLLAACGIQIEQQMISLTGRVLPAPRLILGNGVGCVPNHGKWNIVDKALLEPVKIGAWAVVNFSARVDMNHVSRQLIRCGQRKGIHIDLPEALVMERSRYTERGPVVRVDRMFDQLGKELRDRPKFILCILPESKNNELYGPWNKKCLLEQGITTQCMCPGKHTDRFFGNLLLKINAKLGGINTALALEDKISLPLVQKKATLILGLDVWHGSAGHYDSCSIAAVVGSRCWPSISKYRASVRTQAPKMELIDSLCIPNPNGYDDAGIIREMLLDFYKTSNGKKPEQIIIFRDGVSQSQFNQVLNIEVDQIMKAYEMMGEGPLPKVTVIIAQKRHHTKLFQADNAQMNVPPGTVVDTSIVHPRHYDFYMCTHNGIIGTSRPAHYNVLMDEIGFSVDDLQEFIHSLSYIYQRSTTAVSIVAPIAYAHLAAEKASRFLKFDDYSSDTSSDSGEVAPVPELPRLHENVWDSMFFC